MRQCFVHHTVSVQMSLVWFYRFHELPRFSNCSQSFSILQIQCAYLVISKTATQIRKAKFHTFIARSEIETNKKLIREENPTNMTL